MFRSEHEIWRDEIEAGPRRTTLRGHLWAIAAAFVLAAVVIVIERGAFR